MEIDFVRSRIRSVSPKRRRKRFKRISPFAEESNENEQMVFLLKKCVECLKRERA